MKEEQHSVKSHQSEESTTPVYQPTAPIRSDSLSIPLAIVFAGVLVAGAIIFTEKTAVQQAPVAATVPARQEVGADSDQAAVDLLTIKEDDHILGNPNADVLLIEYTDTECPFCKRFQDTMAQVMDTYGKNGQVAWVYRHFPLDQLHPKARKEAEALECAGELGGNAAYWKYVDKIFEITPGNNGLDAAKLPEIAQMVGLDVAKFNTCYASGKWASRVNRDFENGANVGVRGTPYTIVWNRKTGKQMPINGALPYENVKSIIGIVAAMPSPAS